MRGLNVLGILLLCFVSTALSAQGTAVSIKTGDAELDATLTAMNTEARANIGAFYTQISAEFGISAFKIEISCGSGVMEPAEAYLAAGLAQSTKKRIEDIVALYKTNKKSWAPVFAESGFKAGSPEYKALKAKTVDALAKVKEKNAKK
jgi:hypothetical protein